MDFFTIYRYLPRSMSSSFQMILNLIIRLSVSQGLPNFLVILSPIILNIFPVFLCFTRVITLFPESFVYPVFVQTIFQSGYFAFRAERNIRSALHNVFHFI